MATFDMPGGPVTVKNSRKWQLSADGATLTLEITREGQMTMKSKRVFVKKS